MNLQATIASYRYRFQLWRAGRSMSRIAAAHGRLARETGKTAAGLGIFRAALEGDFTPLERSRTDRWGPWIGLAIMAGTLAIAALAAWCSR